VAVVSDDPAVRKLAGSLANVEWARSSRLDELQRRLARMPGVTVLLVDDECANLRQRDERRGARPAPLRRVMIQRDVCEGCGDCGRRSECPSVEPIATSLGRKTAIHQGSCSQDEACLLGDCPAFVSVPAELALARPLLPAGSLPERRGPEPALPGFERQYAILMVGIGSTGVVTSNAILVAAARRAGLHAVCLDQTGLAQRGGRVTSHLRLLRSPEMPDPRVPHGGADAVLAFDPIGAADAEGLAHLDPARTRTIANQYVTPTAEMVRRPDAPPPRPQPLLDRLAALSRELHALPAEPLAEILLGSPLAANVLLLGFAYQRGAIPIPAACIEGGIEDCGVAVAANRRAFELGRALAADPDAAERALCAAQPRSIGDEGSPERASALYGALWGELAQLVAPHDGPDPELDPSVHPRTTLLVRLAGWAEDLADYQDPAFGRRYLGALLGLARDELTASRAGALVVTPVAARELYRLMACKDEYEVARLLLRGPWRRWLDARAGGRARVEYRLHPPLLRALGLRRKLALGPWFEPLLALLARLRWLRGTRLDPFGYTAARRLDRELADWYPRVLERIRAALGRMDLEQAAAIAGLAGAIRGYEELRAANARQVMAEVERAFAELDDKPDA
jgi:indolepyruvate ferredoxin oxidoreductase